MTEQKPALELSKAGFLSASRQREEFIGGDCRPVKTNKNRNFEGEEGRVDFILEIGGVVTLGVPGCPCFSLSLLPAHSLCCLQSLPIIKLAFPLKNIRRMKDEEIVQAAGEV